MLSFLFLLLPLLLPFIYVYTPAHPPQLDHDPSKADQWRDDIYPYRPQTPWNISNSAFTYPRTLTYTVTEGTWLHLDVHPVSSVILFDMVGTLFCLPPTGGTAIPLFPPGQIAYDAEPRFSPNGSQLLFRSDEGLGVDNIWIMNFHGCIEHERWAATRITNETFRYVSAARFHPSSQSIVATKWYTAMVTIGGPEAWQYTLDGAPDAGKRLISRVESKKKEDYGQSQIGPEQTLWLSNDTLIYLRNIRDEFHIDNAGSGIFDVHKGTLGMFMRNLTTGVEETLVAAGANRPELSRDGRSLAYVKRDRDHEVLLVKDLITGTIHEIYDDLTYDAAVISSIQGSYPSYAFTPINDAIIIWYAGHIHRIPLSINAFGERIASTRPSTIPFQATLTKRLADTRKAQLDLRKVELKEKQKVHAMRELRIDDSNSYAVLDAGGVTVLQSLSSSSSAVVPVLYPSNPYYTPSFLPASTLVIHARWDDANYTTFEIASATEAWEVKGIPKGRYHSPAVSLDHSKMLFVKTAGDVLTGYTRNTAKPGLYLFELRTQKLEFVPSSISLGLGPTQMRFLSESMVLVQQRNRAFTIDLRTGKEEVKARGKLSNEVVIADKTGYKAFLEYHHVYVTREGEGSASPLWAKPYRHSAGLARTSYYGGHDLTWSHDGLTLFWLLGPTIHSVHIPTLYATCSKEIEQDELTFGIECAKGAVKTVEVDVQFDSFRDSVSSEPRNLLLVNAALLTMHTGVLSDDLIHNGSMLVSPQGVILAISPSSPLSYGSYEVLDVQGGYVLPGFIDMHAHWGGYTSLYPASSWEMRTFLAYGVTTLHNPSSDTTTTSLERTRLQRGFSIGPRILTTGTVLFGSSWVGLHEEIVDMQQAREALMRIKLEMGEVALSYKNYQLPSRASRQRLLLVAEELGMVCVPEGGGNLDWDMTYILDGMTTVEHSLPISVLYDDIKKLWAASGTGSTPTHIVSYGGAWGEHIVWAEENLPFDDRLREYIPHNIIEGLSESYARPDNSYAIKNTSISTAQMVHEGGLKTHIGAHGEQPMGLNYHFEMHFTHLGGLSRYEVFKAATIWPAQSLGLDEAIGSLAEGKLAEFLVFQPGVDLLKEEGEIMGGTREILYVAKGGKVWNPNKGMEEIWPEKGKTHTMPDMNP